MSFSNDPRPSIVRQEYGQNQKFASMRGQAKHFPMMLVISTVYPCNFGCPNCPYSEGNSELRSEYKSLGGDYLPQRLWEKIADESGPHRAWLRCTGGGEPMMHPRMTQMITYAKDRGCRVWLNTNGSLFGPRASGRAKLKELIDNSVDIIEFSMDAGDALTYAKVRPPLKGTGVQYEKRWSDQVANVKFALAYRTQERKSTRIVVSVIRQKLVEEKLESIISFWKSIGVDEIITRKFLSWDDNTRISLENSSDTNLYQIGVKEKRQTSPCVWPFERLNIDTMGRVALCGQDISFRTHTLFPNAHDASISEIWNGEAFSRYRRLHLNGDGDTLFPCKGCSAWKAGVRDWENGWIKVLSSSGEKLRNEFRNDLGVEVDVYTPEG